MPRLFVAVDIPEDLRKGVVELQEKIGDKFADIKFVEPENLHYTVKFLGEVEGQKVEEIKKKLDEISGRFERFTISVNFFGFFGSPAFIKVLWIGVGKGKERFIDLAKEVNNKLEYIRKEEYDPSPHLTIGRVRLVKDRNSFLEQIKGFADIGFGGFEVKEIKLKESLPGPKGPNYKDVRAFGFG